MLTFIVALVMCLGAITGLVLVAPSVIYSWRVAPAYYNLARIALPFIALGYFGPQLFGISFPGRNTWITALFLGGLGLIVVAIVVYLYREPGDSQQRAGTGVHSPALASEGLTVRTAQPEDLLGAGTIFAEAFHQSFDLDFGPDRESNARLLADLLAIKRCEVEVAVLPDSGQIVGAMWLDLGDKSIPAMTFGRSWPVLRRYLNGLHATYFALFALPTIMARRGTAEEAYIQWLGVDPNWQGRKVGRKLVERAIELSQATNKREIALHTERSNERARKLYDHSGFEDRSTFGFGPRIRYVKPLY